MNLSFKKSSFALLIALIAFIHIPFSSAKLQTPAKIQVAERPTINPEEEASRLYEKLDLANMGLSHDAFIYAYQGYRYLRAQNKLKNDETLTILDFGLPSSAKRMFVIDMENQKVLYNTYVAHGRNSGREYAKEFSNEPESFKSSLGFYITKGTYSGKHGYSLQLNGEEKGINDNAMSRAIVIHSADYVNKNLIKQQGYIGRSLGCPALPKEVYKPIIQKIKDGSCLFIYSPNAAYTAKSKILQLASAINVGSQNDSV